MSSHEAALRRLRQAVLESPGVIESEQRRGIYHGEPSDERLDRFLARVRGDPASLGGRDIQVLRDAGLAQDEIFEATLAAALGAAARILHAGLKALEDR